MTRKVYKGLLTQQEILQAIKSGIYKICHETGTVRNGGGRVITPFVDLDGRKFVRLYYRDKKKAIAVARLVWMSVPRMVLPFKFEIHHRDENPANDCWHNLICLHKFDHDKLHNICSILGEKNAEGY